MHPATIFLVVSFVTWTASAPQDVAGGNFSLPAVVRGGVILRINYNRLEWNTAREQCEMSGQGHSLVSIDSYTLHDEVVQYLIDQGERRNELWTSGHYDNVERQFEWHDGAALPLFGAPWDQLYPQPSQGTVVAFKINYESPNRGAWAQRPENDRKQSVCMQKW